MSHHHPVAGAPPPTAIMMQAITAKFQTHMLGLVARHKIADHIKPEGSPVAELASATGLNATALYRILRSLTNNGIFHELPNQVFKNSPASELLKVDHPHSVHGMAVFMASDWHTDAWEHIETAAKTNQESFSAAHNGVDIWKFFATHPAEKTVFQNAMSSISKIAKDAIAHTYDFKRFKTICDVGGGNGQMLAAALRAAPESQGILFDLPEVVSATAEVDAGLGDTKSRVTVVGGDMFAEVPKNVDLFILKHIVHDWSDDHCKKFLSNCARSLNKGGRVAVCEHILAGPNEFSVAKQLDVEMLVMTHGGKERTPEEFAALFAASGLKFVGVTSVHGPVQVVEAELP